jgi:hypothetical protein
LKIKVTQNDMGSCGPTIYRGGDLDEQLIFDVAVALKKVKIPGFRKGVVEEGRFEIAKTIVEYLKSNRWAFSKMPLQ